MLNPFELRRQVAGLELISDPAAHAAALLSLYQTTLLAIADPKCPDGRTLAREALKAQGINVRQGDL